MLNSNKPHRKPFDAKESKIQAQPKAKTSACENYSQIGIYVKKTISGQINVKLEHHF